MKDIKIYLGHLNFIDGHKKFLEISTFLEDKQISIEETANNILPKISGMMFTFFNNEEKMSVIEGAFDFVMDNKEFDLFPLIVFLDDSPVFNGFVEKYNLTKTRGYNHSPDKPLNYRFDSVIHKSSELKNKYITRLISYKSIEAKRYFNYLFETNTKITKYIDTEDVAIVGDSTVDSLTISKSDFYNYKTVKVGDNLHRINTISV